MAKDNLDVLKQLIENLEKAELKLEKAYKKNKHDDFNKTKKFILESHQKISDLIRA